MAGISDEERLYEEISLNTRMHFGDRNPTEEDVKSYIGNILMFHLDINDDYPSLKLELDRGAFIQRVFIQYWQEQSVRQNIGAYLVSTDDNTPWLPEREEELSWDYWTRYKQYLEIQQGWSKDVVATIGADSKEILALTGNPCSKTGFRKRGLVVGNVQSGKTANYLGLMCRAADVGYRYIVVLASTTNDLREQTQKRIEEGFIGIDYSPFLSGVSSTPVRVGVGKLATGSFKHPNPGTTRVDDFNRAKMKSLIQVRDQNIAEPWVFVIKKNAYTLRNLIEWLRSSNIDPHEDQLFLIDDEADYASINTQARKDKITRINKQIRELLQIFTKSVYVGYTATPYANILIDQDSMDDVVGADIFPRNFIYTLSAADSYFGASKVLADIEPDDDQIVTKPKHVRFIEPDDQDMIPPSAKEFETPVLPSSMIDAIRTFVLASTIRIVRKGADTHTSMLVNVSPYNKPQQQIKRLIDYYIEDRLKPAFKTFGYKNPDYAYANSAEIREVKRCWDYEFDGTVEYTWQEIFLKIQPLLMKYLKTAEINSKSKDGLNFNDPLDLQHVIAVGGYRLSRGLTLEGLLVSYYSRNTRAYDSLLQMSRWFGHRAGYEDLCRVWMTAESAGWCKFVADATEELMYDLVVMQQQHKTPLEFGQRVRAHPGTLMVTARNKMGAGELVGDASLNGKLVEASVLPRESPTRENNIEAARRLQEVIEDGDYKYEIWKGNVNKSGGYGVLFRDVPRDIIEDFVSNYVNDDASMLSKQSAILEQIGFCNDEGLELWSVMFSAVNPNAKNLGDVPPKYFDCVGMKFRKQRRSPGNRTDSHRIYVGNRFKVSTTEIDSVGLSVPVQHRAIEEWKEAHSKNLRVSVDYFYRKHRCEPLLVIHYLDMRFLNEDEYGKACQGVTKKGGVSRDGKLSTASWENHETSVDTVAWSISFPPLKKDRHVRYVFNKVALEQMGLVDDRYDEDEEEQFDE